MMSCPARRSFAMPGSKTRPGLFGDTPVMLVGPNVLPGRGGASLWGSGYAMMWWTWPRALGLISTAVYQRSSGRFTGIRRYRYWIVPAARILFSSVIVHASHGVAVV